MHWIYLFSRTDETAYTFCRHSQKLEGNINLNSFPTTDEIFQQANVFTVMDHLTKTGHPLECSGMESIMYQTTQKNAQPDVYSWMSMGTIDGLRLQSVTFQSILRIWSGWGQQSLQWGHRPIITLKNINKIRSRYSSWRWSIFDKKAVFLAFCPCVIGYKTRSFLLI